MTLVRPLARPIAGVLLCGAYSGLFAQEEELDEIVVSADYRGRPVAEIPASRKKGLKPSANSAKPGGGFASGSSILTVVLMLDAPAAADIEKFAFGSLGSP